MKRLLCLSLALLFILSTFGCKKTEEVITGYPVEAGGVTFEYTPKRVIAMSRSIYESVVVLGYRQRLVGVGSAAEGPGTIDKLPECGTTLDPDVDAMIKLTPDLVLTPADLPASAVKKLEEAGAKVLTVPHANSLKAYEASLSALGTIFAGSETGPLIAEDISYYVDATLDYLSDNIPEGMKAAVVMRLPNNAATGDTWIHDLIERAGMTNCAESGEGWYYAPGEGETAEADILFCDESITDEALSKSIWKNTSAYTGGRVVYFDSSILEAQSPAAIAAFEAVVKEAFPDVDWGEKPSVTVYRKQPEPEPTTWEKIKQKLGID